MMQRALLTGIDGAQASERRQQRPKLSSDLGNNVSAVQ